ncbi:MAG: B12-binding domain-containing radical SAM protein, partial [Bacillota bacterium]|nr:B12-binding domain-containing radical SAM protein [Bacillota bacterium]
RPEHMSIRKFYLELLIAYYKIVMRPKHIIALIKKHGIKSNLKMLIGSSFVSLQYIKKIVRGY